MTCPLEALGEYVVVRPDDAETRTPGGIHLPDTAQRKQSSGVVVSVGAAVSFALGLRPGDRVFYALGANWHRIETGGAVYVAMHEREVFARLGPAVPDGVPEGLA